MNSRPQISNHRELAEHIRRFSSHAVKHGTRAVVVVCAPPLHWLTEFTEQYGFDYALDCANLDSGTDRADRIGSLLGTERLRAAIQFAPTPDHGLLAALAGTVQAGGILLVGTATQAEKPESDTPKGPVSQPSTQSYATQRLIRIADHCAETFPQQAFCVQFIGSDLRTPVFHRENTTERYGANSDPARIDPYLNPQAIAEQASLFATACNHIDTHTRTSLVITGRRGRGKSTLLARIAEYLQQNGESFRITSMHASALCTYRKHSESLALHYVSPESVGTEHIETLFVDEASSFSLKRLQTFMRHCQRLVICSTIEGYESAGRALEIRLLPELAKTHPTLLRLEPAEPWRWANNDPLEKFVDDLLLAKSALATTQTPATPLHLNLQSHPLEHSRVLHISQHELAGNELLLAQVHALLSAAHYQSSAKDLEHLLDAPSVQLWVQQLGSNVIAVLLLEHEGCIDFALHEPIVSKKRRIPNQLLPQLLAQSANTSDALSSRYVRVLRIAVQPELRRQRLATSLLTCVQQQLGPTDQAIGQAIDEHRHSPGIDAIGASFAADEGSLAFWNSLGYTEFHRGYRANPRTGKRAVAVMKTLNTKTHAVLTTAASIHRANELARHSSTTDASTTDASKTDADAADANTTKANTADTPAILASARETSEQEDTDLPLLTRFANGQRSAHDTYAALYRLSQTISLPLTKKQQQSQRDYELEMRHNVQRWLTWRKADKTGL